MLEEKTISICNYFSTIKLSFKIQQSNFSRIGTTFDSIVIKDVYVFFKNKAILKFSKTILQRY